MPLNPSDMMDVPNDPSVPPLLPLNDDLPPLFGPPGDQNNFDSEYHPDHKQPDHSSNKTETKATKERRDSLLEQSRDQVSLEKIHQMEDSYSQIKKALLLELDESSEKDLFSPCGPEIPRQETGQFHKEEKNVTKTRSKDNLESIFGRSGSLESQDFRSSCNDNNDEVHAEVDVDELVSPEEDCVLNVKSPIPLCTSSSDVDSPFRTSTSSMKNDPVPQTSTSPSGGGTKNDVYTIQEMPEEEVASPTTADGVSRLRNYNDLAEEGRCSLSKFKFLMLSGNCILWFCFFLVFDFFQHLCIMQNQNQF